MLKMVPIAVSLAFLASLATYIVAFPPGEVGATYLELCPTMIAGCPGEDLGMDETVLDDLQPNAILSRRYVRPDGLPVWVLIVYFENARTRAHDPLLCYRSQGFELEMLPDRNLESALGTIPVQTFRAVRGSRDERVYHFWYTAGESVIGEMKTFRDDMFLQGLLRNRSFGAFVRISTLDNGEPAEAIGYLDTFTREVAAHLPRFFPEPDSKRES